MSFRVSGKNIDIGEALRTRVSSRVAEAVDKYFNGGYSGHVTVGKEAFGFRTECVVHLDSGIILQSDAMAGDAYSSADQAAERIEKRLRRYKRRLKDRHAARANGRHADALSTIDAPSYVIEAPHDESDEAAEFNPVIIAESTTVLTIDVGQRCGAGARYDRGARCGVPSRRARPHQSGIPST